MYSKPSTFSARRYFVALLVVAITILGVSAFGDDELRKAIAASEKGDSAEAEKLLTSLIEKSPSDAIAYYWRGRERFRLAKIKESVADFDEYVKLAPEKERQLWERGISLYYLGEFERGAKQFELYQTYHDTDVENAAWRYLCQARASDPKTALKDLLPIKGDRRPVLMDIYAMFKGEKRPADVLTACEQVSGDERKEVARFYAHLYLGIYFEAHGDAKKSLEHIRLAAEKHREPGYMGDTAAVHLKLRRTAPEKKASQ
jgi:lipoprotein NlpI